MSDTYFPQVSKPVNFPLRPLNKGMVLNRPSQLLEGSMCVDAKNYIISENGPRRRPGYEPYGGTEAGYEALVQSPYKHIDLFTFWTSEVGAEDQQLLLVTDGPLYKVGLGGLEEVAWDFSDGTADVSGISVTFSAGVDLLDWPIYPGDLFRCGGGEGRVEEVISSVSLELEAGHTVPDGNGQSYVIQRAFNDDVNYLADWVVFNNEVIFTDYNAPPVVYTYSEAEGSQMSLFIDNDYYRIDSGTGPEDFVARCVAVFQDRVYFGNLIEVTDGLRRQRIRWSSATNPRDFSDSTAWIDLPYTQGSIVRLVPLDNLLIVYLSDAIYVGTPTQNPNLPVVFQRVETGSVGLVGMKAITSYLEGHFFVGQDDIYLMTTRGPERIGSTVVSRTVKESEHRERIYAALDVENERVVFGFTKERTMMEELWSFSYKNKAWSHDSFETYMVANPLLVFDLTWEALAGFTWSGLNPIGSTFRTWDSMGLKENVIRLFVENSGALRQLSDGLGVDRLLTEDAGVIEETITAVYETGDFDFGEPDRVKTFMRLSMKVDFDTAPSESVLFAVQGSWDRGRSWRSLGTLTVAEQYDEGYVNFLISSSHVRFRITTTSSIGPFTITEIVLRVKGRGAELALGGQAP